MIVASGGKRVAVAQYSAWEDWFVSFSPRASGSMAEGPWDHWVDLAIQILQHRLTEVVRPDAYDVASRWLVPEGFYDETKRELTQDEITAAVERTTQDHADRRAKNGATQ